MSVKIYYDDHYLVLLCENNARKTSEKLFDPVPPKPNMPKRWIQLRTYSKVKFKSVIFFVKLLDIPFSLIMYSIIPVVVIECQNLKDYVTYIQVADELPNDMENYL